jgi:hypothetical protein
VAGRCGCDEARDLGGYRVEPAGRDDARLGWQDDSHHDRMVGSFEEFEEEIGSVDGASAEDSRLGRWRI